MDFRAQTGAIKLFKQVLDEGTPTSPLVETPSHKPRYLHAPQQHLERAIPEEEGVSSAFLADLARSLHEDPTLDMHGLLVARHGKVLMEADFGAYTHEVWHSTFSLCKSVTGLAVGLLWDEGKIDLDGKALPYFEGTAGALSNLTQGNLTIRHLLTMRSGALFNEAGAVTVDDWSKAFLSSMLKFEPGAQFDYNSMNSYMLAVIVKKAAGMGVMDYLRPRLFEPLGIQNVFWEKSPEEVEKGGWGMYILPEDELKLGQLLLDRGMWQGKRILSEEWIDMATQRHSQAPASLGNYDYGFQLWVGREQRVWLFNGLFGQNVFIYPDTGFVVVTSAGNSESFQTGALFDILERAFAKDRAFPPFLPRDGAQYMALLKTLEDLRRPAQRSRLPLDALKEHMGVYQTNDKRAASVGLLPLLEQGVQNSFARGLHGVMLRKREEETTLTFFEGDKRHDLPVNLVEPRIVELLLCGQYYRVAVTSVLTMDEDENPVLKIRLSFQEIPNARLMKIHFLGNGLLLRMRELPGRDYVKDSLDAFLSQHLGKRLMGPLTAHLDGDFAAYKLERAFEPELFFQRTE